MRRVLVTGSSGLVGSACVRHFDSLGWQVAALDNDSRREFFGKEGSTQITKGRLIRETKASFYVGDICDPNDSDDAIRISNPQVVIHCAAQPSHDWATKNPRRDFEVNALGTLNLLEIVRRRVPGATFIFMSTNKVYGDWPNHRRRAGWLESETRYYEPYASWQGFTESTPIDGSRHSIFGASKLAADVMVQEYGLTYGMKTCCFRAGCLTGSAHAAVELHGFLAYLVKCAKEGRTYRIYGYKGKQVRDNLHAYDVARACEEFAKNPKVAAVYNLGGGRENSISILEAIEELKRRGYELKTEYVDEPRGGDHICYYSDTTKFRTDYPGWKVTKTLADIFDDLCGVPELIHA